MEKKRDEGHTPGKSRGGVARLRGVCVFVWWGVWLLLEKDD